MKIKAGKPSPNVRVNDEWQCVMNDFDKDQFE